MKEEFDELDALVEYIREYEEQHKNTPMLLDPVQFLKFKQCYDGLTAMILAEGSKIKTKITMNWFKTGMCSFNIETDELSVRDMEAFVKLIEPAANFDVYPLLNENIRISVMFHNVMRAVK